MFFHFHVPPQQEEIKKAAVELNVDDEPKYLRTLDGKLVINDPTLVKVVSVTDWTADSKVEGVTPNSPFSAYAEQNTTSENGD